MNTKIINYKNNSSNALRRRIIMLERMVQQLIQISENEMKNNSHVIGDAFDFGNDKQSGSRPEFVSLPFGDKQSENINLASVIRAKDTLKINRNNLLLSQGQIIAELASAIARASKRSS